MTAYGAPYLVAAKANIYTLSISHTFPIGWKWLGNIMMYHDFGIIQNGIPISTIVFKMYTVFY